MVKMYNSYWLKLAQNSSFRYTCAIGILKRRNEGRFSYSHQDPLIFNYLVKHNNNLNDVQGNKKIGNLKEDAGINIRRTKDRDSFFILSICLMVLNMVNKIPWQAID